MNILVCENKVCYFVWSSYIFTEYSFEIMDMKESTAISHNMDD